MIESRLRLFAASIWTATAIGLTITALHAWWFVDSDHKAGVISGFGVALAVLGIFVAAQPLIRAGVRTTARWQFGLGEDFTNIEEAADASRRVFDAYRSSDGLLGRAISPRRGPFYVVSAQEARLRSRARRSCIWKSGT